MVLAIYYYLLTHSLYHTPHVFSLIFHFQFSFVTRYVQTYHLRISFLKSLSQDKIHLVFHLNSVQINRILVLTILMLINDKNDLEFL